MRYDFDGNRNGYFKTEELELEICNYFGCTYTQLLSSSMAVLTITINALGIAYEVIYPAFTSMNNFGKYK
jgi:8-amino-3,8-dideoxy-alpha-D-manno-octulosonate transaminase